MNERPIETEVLASLDRAGVAYETLPCDPEAADTAVFCERYGVDPADSANTIVIGSRKEPRRYAACVVLAPDRLDVNGVIKRRLDAGKVSFVRPDDAVALTGMLVGGVTPSPCRRPSRSGSTPRCSPGRR